MARAFMSSRGERDLLVGAPGEVSDGGAVYILPRTRITARMLGMAAGDGTTIGHSVTLVDENGDGFVAVGALDMTRDRAGAALIVGFAPRTTSGEVEERSPPALLAGADAPAPSPPLTRGEEVEELSLIHI